MKYESLPEYDHHEIILDLSVHSKKLKGYIAIHNTNLGPAVGGTRIFPYKSKKEALKDVLRLSHAMTYKCAVSGLPFGGGKGVIMADPYDKNFKEILYEYALVIKHLNGKFYTGEDVGLAESDVQYMLTVSPFFIGKTGKAGDPSVYAAESCYICLKTGLKHLNKPIKNVSVAIKGVGKTGSHLLHLLSQHTKNIAVADKDHHRLKYIKKKYPFINIVSFRSVHKLPVTVYSPCALGNEVTEKNISEINAKMICGTANNQLANPGIGEKLVKRKILYIPDFVANAGGLMNVADELLPGGYNPGRVLKHITDIDKVLKRILIFSKKKKKNPNTIAIEMAERIYNNA